MSSVDDRIVNMQFNNKQFVSGANESEKALQGLEKTLANTGKGKGMDQLGAAVDQTTKKFSIMQVTGITAVATIANKAVNAGINLVKSLTIDPIMDGFHEYQTNLKSVQTIMANTGKGVKVVNGYLEQMNKFSDMTIYNFSEMAKNVGTFTAAGVGLKQATASIKGIATIAALSGSSSQQASVAMYQLSQAIAAGRVGLQDWNSVVNAGMGGKKLQTALAQTAVAMGKLDANAIKGGKSLKIMGQSFRDSIASKPGQVSWLSSDVLTKTLALMDGRLSRTRMAMEGIEKVGEQNAVLEQRRLKLAEKGVVFTDKQWKNMVKMADAGFAAATQAKTLSDVLQTARESVGSLWAETFKNVIGNFKQSKKLWTGVQGEITGFISGINTAINGTRHEVDGVMVGSDGILATWKKFDGRKNTLQGIKTIFQAIGSVIGQLKPAFDDVFGGSNADAGKSLAAFSEGFRKFAEALTPSKATLEDLRDIFGGVFAVLHIGVTIVKGIATAFGTFFSALFKGSSEGRSGILDFLGGIGKALKALDKAITSGGNIQDIFAGIGQSAAAVVGPILKMVGYLVQAFAALATGKGFSGFGAAFEGVKSSFADLISILAGAGATITAPFESLSGWFDKIQAKADNFKSSLSGVTDVFGGFGGGGEGMEKAAGPIEKTSKSLLNATASMVGLKNASSEMSTTGEKVTGSLGHITTSTDGMKSSLGSMAGTMSDQLGKASEAVASLGADSMESESAFDRFKSVMSAIGTGITKVFQGIGTAVGWLGDQFGKLFGDKSALDWATLMNALFTGAILLGIRNMLKGLQGFTDFFKDLPDTLHTFNDTMKGVKDTLADFTSGVIKAAMLRAIAISVGILVASLVALAFVKYEDIGKGLGAIATLMSLLVGAMFVLSKVPDPESSLLAISSAFLGIAAAIAILAVAVVALGNMDIQNLAKGVGAIAFMIGFLVAAMFGLSKISGTTAVASSAMIAMAFAVGLLTASVLALSLVPMDNLAKGIGALAALMALMTGSMVVMSSFGKFAVGGAAAMLGMAAAVTMLVPAIVALGTIKAGTIWKGIGALAAVVLILTASLVALSLAGPATILAGASLIMFSLAINMLIPAILTLGMLPWSVILKALGALVLLAIPITLLGIAALVAAPGFVALGAALLMAGTGMFLFGTGFAILTAAGVAGVGILVVAFQAFLALLPQLGVQMAAAFVSFVQTIAAASTQLRAAFTEIFKAFLGVIQDSIPLIVDLINELVNGIFDVLENAIPRAIKYFTKLIRAGLRAVRTLIPEFITTGWAVINAFIDGIDDNIEDVVKKGGKIIRKLIRGIGDEIVASATAFGETILAIINGLDAAIVTYQPQILEAGGRLVGHFIDGMTGGMLGKGLERVKAAARKLADAIPGPIKDLLGIDSPSKVARDLLYWVPVGMALGLQDGMDLVGRAATNLANNVAAKVAAGTGGGGGKKNKFYVGGETLAQAIVAGIDNALQSGVVTALHKLSNLLAKGSADITDQIDRQYAAQIQADQAKAEADALSNAASKAKGKGKKKKLTKLSNKAQNRADKAQAVADNIGSTIDQLTAVRDAGGDQAAIAEALTTNAQDLGDQARDLLAESQGKALAAAKLEAKGDKKAKRQAKALRDQAAELARQAKLLADQSTALQIRAAEAAGKAAKATVDAVRAEHDAELKARADAKAFEEADQAGKLKILQDRADKAKADAAHAESEYQRLIADADAALAQGRLADAENLAAQAQAAADQAEAFRDAEKQALDDIKNLQGGGNGGTGGSSFTPSASILENAASAVDSFSKSMQEAMEAAGATPSIVQFNQTNNSPEALNPSEVYRQTNNLVSFAATKFTPIP